jgi:hypothetical protein
MGDRLREIECCRCGHTWHVNLDKLDEQDLEIYKGGEKKTYRVPCPVCQTGNVFAEGEDG